MTAEFARFHQAINRADRAVQAFSDLRNLHILPLLADAFSIHGDMDGHIFRAICPAGGMPFRVAQLHVRQWFSAT